MIQRVATVLCRFYGDRKAFLDVFLSGKLVKARRTERAFYIAFVARSTFWRNNALVVHIFSIVMPAKAGISYF